MTSKTAIPRSVYHSWYYTPEWRAAKRAQLSKQPCCEKCLQRGEQVKATVVNHRIPHKGNWRLFVDQNNHESVCKPCHDGLIQREEVRGFKIGHDANGFPLDEHHPWAVARRIRENSK